MPSQESVKKPGSVPLDRSVPRASQRPNGSRNRGISPPIYAVEATIRKFSGGQVHSGRQRTPFVCATPHAHLCDPV